jgi:hypothetical protein
MDDIGEAMGPLSLVAMIAVISTGVFMKRRYVLFRGAHKVAGFVTAALATVHGLTMMMD